MKRSLDDKHLFEEMQAVAERLFEEVRREEGFFQTGSCLHKGRRVLLINSRQPLQERIAAMAREIAAVGGDKVYLKPAVRAEVDRFSGLAAPEPNT